MNGESAFGWFKVFFALAVLAILGWIAYKLASWIKGKGGVAGAALDTAQTIKDSTPLGAPSRAIDTVISAATGRDETLGGAIAEVFDPATKKVNDMGFIQPAADKLKPTGPDAAPETDSEGRILGIGSL